MDKDILFKQYCLQEGKRNGEFRITASVNGISSIMGDYVDDKLEVDRNEYVIF